MVTANRESLWSRDYLLILLTAFFAMTVMFTMGSGMTLLVNQNGGGTSITGIMVFGSSVGSILGSLLGGRLCDTWGTRKVLMAFSIGCAVVTFLPAVFSSFTMLVILRFLQGLLYPGFFVAIPAAIARLAPARRLGEAMGYCGTVIALGEAIGPTVAIRVFAADKVDILLSACAGLFLLDFIFPLSCRYENRPSGPAPEAAPGMKTDGGLLWRLLEKKALGLAIFNFIYSVALCIFFNYLPLYVAQSGIAHYGYFYILQFVAMVISRLTTGRLIDRRGPIRAFIPAILSGMLAFLLILTGNNFLFLLSGIFYGLCSGVMTLLQQTVCMRYAPSNRGGAATATLNIFGSFGMGLGALLWGKLIEVTGGGYRYAFIGAVICLFLSGILGFNMMRDKVYAFRVMHREHAETPPPQPAEPCV
jgi:MFS family permease